MPCLTVLEVLGVVAYDETVEHPSLLGFNTLCKL